MLLLQELLPNEILTRLPVVLWTFVRFSAVLIAAPMFGARTVPARVRVMLALLLAFTVAPQVTVPQDIAIFSGAGALLVVREVLIGVSMGFLLQLIFAAMATAGEVIALSMGLAFANVVDPERGVSVPVVSQHFVVMATLMFLALDGHMALIALVFESFSVLPPASAGLAASGFFELAAWVSRMFEAAILVALPASASLLVAGISMGLIARSAPQLNIFAVGFPMTLMLGITALMLSLPLLAPQFTELMAAVFEQARLVLGAFR
jgi:flagellar biosynthetic protein FliR